eukprot:m.217558 g.217558  ORF g.217558 m.217558 type:complete len:74 (-) comp54110_c0_seq1:76-297(-)
MPPLSSWALGDWLSVLRLFHDVSWTLGCQTRRLIWLGPAGVPSCLFPPIVLDLSDVLWCEDACWQVLGSFGIE